MERVCRCPVARKNLAFKSCLEPSEVFEFFSFHARPPRLPAASPLLLAGRNVCVVHRFASFHPESREGQLFRGGGESFSFQFLEMKIFSPRVFCAASRIDGLIFF